MFFTFIALYYSGHVRQLRYSKLTDNAFRGAMLSPETGLTHAALVGLRKQSVPDAERLLSHHVADWMLRNGYQDDGEFVQVKLFAHLPLLI